MLYYRKWNNNSGTNTPKQHKYSVVMVATQATRLWEKQRVNFNNEDKSGYIVSDKFFNNNASKILNNESDRLFRISEKLN